MQDILQRWRLLLQNAITSANISTFKRSIEAVTALEKITPSEEDDNENYELTPEKIDEFAKKAGLR